jgi:hypothetical protein
VPFFSGKAETQACFRRVLKLLPARWTQQVNGLKTYNGNFMYLSLVFFRFCTYIISLNLTKPHEAGVFTSVL